MLLSNNSFILGQIFRMRYFLSGIIIIWLASCSSDSSVKQQLSGADSLVINFTEKPSGSITKTVTTTEKKAVEKLISFINGKPTKEFKCSYNGNLQFFSRGNLLSHVSFDYSETGCRHFLFSIDGKLESTVMDNEAVDFLKSLAEGKDWY